MLWQVSSLKLKKKVSLIRESEETNQDCVLELYDEEFGRLRIATTLRNALLSSISIENGQVKTIMKKIEQTKPKEEKPSASKISFKTIKNAINKVLGKGER